LVPLLIMRFLFTLLLSCVSTGIFAGGPWLLPKKSGFFQLQTTLPAGGYTTLFQSDGSTVALNRSVVDVNFQAYLEYGITNRLDVIGVLPYKFISTGDTLSSGANSELLDKGSLNGFSNPRLGFKYGVFDKGINLAISIQSTFNTISEELDKGLITGYDANSIGLYTHLGKSFSEKLYSFIDAGFNLSSNNFSDFIEVHYELGYQLRTNFWGVITLDVRETLENGSAQSTNLNQTGFYTNDQEYFAFGVKLAYELKSQLGFTAATFGAFSGHNVAQIGTFSFGVYKKW